VFLDQLVRVNRLSRPYLISYQRCRPIGGFAGAILFFFLNLNPHQGMSLQQHLSQFDFLGLALFMSGIVCVLIGLNSGETRLYVLVHVTFSAS
jgi:hypothetical protein